MSTNDLENIFFTLSLPEAHAALLAKGWKPVSRKRSLRRDVMIKHYLRAEETITLVGKKEKGKQSPVIIRMDFCDHMGGYKGIYVGEGCIPSFK